MSETGSELATMPKLGRQGDDDRVAHLVLRSSWPIALCGAMVRDRLGAEAPGRDRCTACLKIAADRKLGRPGWA